MRIIFACGGTAGHINPALAVAGRIKALMPDARRLFPQHKRGVASCPLHHKGKEDHKTL